MKMSYLFYTTHELLCPIFLEVQEPAYKPKRCSKEFGRRGVPEEGVYTAVYAFYELKPIEEIQ